MIFRTNPTLGRLKFSVLFNCSNSMQYLTVSFVSETDHSLAFPDTHRPPRVHHGSIGSSDSLTDAQITALGTIASIEAVKRLNYFGKSREKCLAPPSNHDIALSMRRSRPSLRTQKRMIPSMTTSKFSKCSAPMFAKILQPPRSRTTTLATGQNGP